MIDDLPEFLKIPPAERKAAWEKFRAERKLLPVEKSTYRPIGDLPGAAPNADPDA